MIDNFFRPPHEQCDCRTCLDAKIEWQGARIERLTRTLINAEDAIAKLTGASEEVFNALSTEIHEVLELQDPDPPEDRHDDPAPHLPEPDPVAFGLPSRHGSN